MFNKFTLHEKWPNTELFLVRIFPHSDWMRTGNNSVFGQNIRQKLFSSHFLTEISHSCFSRIFVKVYIVMANLKWHNKTIVITLFSFSQWHWSDNENNTSLSNLHNCQFSLRAINFIYSNMKWLFYKSY